MDSKQDLKQDLQKLVDEKNKMRQQIAVSVEVITPEHARNFLMKNLGDGKIANRKIHPPTVNNYVKDILNGRWKIGVPFLFDTAGNMVDGQTRCTAIVKANRSIVSLIIRGVDSNIFDILDCGKKRTHKDVLTSLINEKGDRLEKAATVAAALNLVQSIQRNHTAIDKNRGLLTNTEIIEIVRGDFNYYNDPFKPYKTSPIVTWRKNIHLAINESLLAAFYYIHKKTHGDIVDTFLTTITTNDTTTPSIVREFRDMVIANKSKKSDERGFISPIGVYRAIEILFKYSQEKNGLAGRKHFLKTDLQSINE